MAIVDNAAEQFRVKGTANDQFTLTKIPSTGPDRAVVVTIVTRGAADVVGAEIGGAAMTAITSSQGWDGSSTPGRSRSFYLDEAGVAARTDDVLSFSWSAGAAAQEIRVHAWSFTSMPAPTFLFDAQVDIGTSSFPKTISVGAVPAGSAALMTAAHSLINNDLSCNVGTAGAVSSVDDTYDVTSNAFWIEPAASPTFDATFDAADSTATKALYETIVITPGSSPAPNPQPYWGVRIS